MVDFNKMFKKLADETPEQRQDRQAQRDREHEEWVAARIAEKVELIELCLRHGLARSPREEEFLQQLQSKAERNSVVHHIRGGDLLGLSDPQVRWLKDIASRAPAQQTPSAAAQAPANQSRAQRFRGRGG